MVEDIGLLTVRPANVICVVGKAMKQEPVNPVRQRSGEQIKNGNPERWNQVSAGCLVQSSPPQAEAVDIQACIENEPLVLALW